MHGLTGGGWKRGNLRHRASPLPSQITAEGHDRPDQERPPDPGGWRPTAPPERRPGQEPNSADHRACAETSESDARVSNRWGCCGLP